MSLFNFAELTPRTPRTTRSPRTPTTPSSGGERQAASLARSPTLGNNNGKFTRPKVVPPLDDHHHSSTNSNSTQVGKVLFGDNEDSDRVSTVKQNSDASTALTASSSSSNKREDSVNTAEVSESFHSYWC